MFSISIKTLLPFAFAMTISGLAWAHSESELRNRIPPHGGLLAEAGAYHVELVLKPDRVQVFVADPQDKPINIQGVTGSANLRAKGEKPSRCSCKWWTTVWRVPQRSPPMSLSQC